MRGASKAAIDAVAGIADIVEELHRQIVSVASLNASIDGAFRRWQPVGREASPATPARSKVRTTGITGLVYRSVHGVTTLVGSGLDTAFATYQQLVPIFVQPSAKLNATNSASQSNVYESGLAALNGVFGDYLEATKNALAINMSLRVQGKPIPIKKSAGNANSAESAHAVQDAQDAIKKFLAKSADQPKNQSQDQPQANGKLLILVHGLCMNDRQWLRDHHDHGALLARELGYMPLYLHYNTGRHIATNGVEFAALLEQLVQQWPVPITELVMIGHSMGGLVSRNACEAARQAKHTWLRSLKKMIFLGTPHHGAPLERAGHWVDILLGMNAYSAPFAKLSKVRSAGIQDLRYGNIDGNIYGNIMDTVAGAKRAEPKNATPPKLSALPKGVKCYLIAATKQAKTKSNFNTNINANINVNVRLPGDGLVPVNSALGIHQDATLTLKLPATRRKICYGVDHFDLLSNAEVYAQLHSWLAKS